MKWGIRKNKETDISHFDAGPITKTVGEIYITKKQNEVATVEVRDIKQYLVNEYERSKDLERKIEYYKSEIERYKEIELKYDASLVTLDEYKRRLDGFDDQKKKLENKIETLSEKVKQAKEETNDIKIILNNTARDKEGMREEIIAELKADIVEKLTAHKGALSKKRAIEIVEGCNGNREKNTSFNEQ